MNIYIINDYVINYLSRSSMNIFESNKQMYFNNIFDNNYLLFYFKIKNLIYYVYVSWNYKIDNKSESLKNY